MIGIPPLGVDTISAIVLADPSLLIGLQITVRPAVVASRTRYTHSYALSPGERPYTLIVSPASTVAETDADRVRVNSLLVARILLIPRVLAWFGIVPRPLIFHTTPPVVEIVGVVAPIKTVNCVGLKTALTSVGAIRFGKSVRLNTP